MINAAVPMKQHLLVDCYVFLFFYCLKYYTIIYFCFAVKIEFLSGFILGNNFKIEFLCGLFPVLFWEITLRLGLFWTANLSSYSSCFSLWRQRQNFHSGKINIATGETSPVISSLNIMTFITRLFSSLDKFHHRMTFITK